MLNQSAGVLQGVYQLGGLPHRVVVLGKLYRGRHQLHLLHTGAGENIRRLGADALNLPAELGGQLRNAVPVLALQILPGLFLQLIGNGHAHRVQGKGKNPETAPKAAWAGCSSARFLCFLFASCVLSLLAVPSGCGEAIVSPDMRWLYCIMDAPVFHPSTRPMGGPA